MRFYLKWLNPTALERAWTAEECLLNPLSPILPDATYDSVTNTIVSFKETPLNKKVSALIKEARHQYTVFLSSGSITDDLLRGALCLAQIDPIVRRGYVDENLGIVHQEDIVDLHNLLSVVDPKVFKARKVCLLNPTFGDASRLVKGADCDLIIDDMLIELKTTKKPEFQTPYFYEIMGYVTLSQLRGLDSLQQKPELHTGAVYFARHGYLFSFDLAQASGGHISETFLQWFKDRAELAFSHSRESSS
jgi:hypothetical protein